MLEPRLFASTFSATGLSSSMPLYTTAELPQPRRDASVLSNTRFRETVSRVYLACPHTPGMRKGPCAAECVVSAAECVVSIQRQHSVAGVMFALGPVGLVLPPGSTVEHALNLHPLAFAQTC